MKRILQIRSTLLASLLLCGAVGCTTQESNSGGTGGSAGPSGTGGSSGGLGTLCPLPAQVISDFTFNSDAATADVRYGGNGTLSGGGSVYPSTLTQDLAHGSWHLSGTVNTYTGFTLYFDNCDRVDASKYKGISFTVSGAATGGLTMSVGTAGDTATWTWMAANGKTAAKETDVGRCTPTQNTSNQYYTPGCTAPSKAISVSATPTPVSVLWTDLTGGAPETSPNAAQITSIAWAFQWADGGSPYTVDLVFDDLAFIP